MAANVGRVGKSSFPPDFTEVCRSAAAEVRRSSRKSGVAASGEDYIREWCKVSKQRSRNTTDLGNLFELLCLRAVKANALPGQPKVAEVSLLSNLSPLDRRLLGLRKQDMGVDLVARLKPKKTGEASETVAIQAKFRMPGSCRIRRGPGRGKTRVPWSDLATFYALASEARTPEDKPAFDRTWLITTADSASSGVKNGRRRNHRTFAFKSLGKMPVWFWIELEGAGKGRKLNEAAGAADNAGPSNAAEKRRQQLAALAARGMGAPPVEQEPEEPEQPEQPEPEPAAPPPNSLEAIMLRLKNI